MSGNKTGAAKGVLTTKRIYGPDHHAKIGALGGKAVHKLPHGFQVMPKDRLLEVSSLGGKKSKRGKKPIDNTNKEE